MNQQQETPEQAAERLYPLVIQSEYAGIAPYPIYSERINALRRGYIKGLEDAMKWIPVIQEPEKDGWFIVRDPNSPFRNKVQIARYSKYNNMWFENHESDDSLHPDYYIHILPESPANNP